MQPSVNPHLKMAQNYCRHIGNGSRKIPEESQPISGTGVARQRSDNPLEFSALKTMLSGQVDGATIISPEGLFQGTGAQLQPSTKSKQTVSEYKGTRHTSARRFSYDFDGSIVVVVSGDAKVSIFSDGASIADLRTVPTRHAAELLRQNDEATPDSVRSFRQLCAGCGKLCVIQGNKLSDEGRTHSIQCPVCNRTLLSIAGSTAEVYVLKATSVESQENERVRRDHAHGSFLNRPELPRL